MGERRAQARAIARALIDGRVARLLEILDERDPDLKSRLRLQPRVELDTWSDVEVLDIPANTQNPDCSIAGVYVDTVVPAQIGVVEGSYYRRETFTVLHELGHHLQRTTELVDDLPGQPDRGAVLEEATSDAFAAAILLPRSEVDAAIGSGTPSVSQVRELWLASPTASRAAVCVRAAQHLASPGYVMLLDRDGRISFAAAHNTFPLRKGLDQSATTLAAAVRDNPFGVVARKTRFRFASGQESDEFYAQATELDGYTLIVAVADGAPWERISLSSVQRPTFKKWHECSSCGELTAIGEAESCDVCRTVKCGDCGRCACPSRVAELLCTECWIVKPAQQFPSAGTVCLECVS